MSDNIYLSVRRCPLTVEDMLQSDIYILITRTLAGEYGMEEFTLG